MTVTAASFLVNHTEFTTLHAEDAPLIEATIARAERRVSPTWPEETRDDMVMLQAADMLAQGPWGRNAKLSEPGKPTAYRTELDERKKAHACGRSRIV
jgi:hypothetical protein